MGPNVRRTQGGVRSISPWRQPQTARLSLRHTI